MRNVILLDNKIADSELKKWQEEDVAFWNKYVGITPSYVVIRHDYTEYPTFIDSDGDIRPTNAYLQSLNDFVTSMTGEFGVDFILVVVHKDNWRSDPPGPGNGIWGTNYSYHFGKQTLQYCRWDSDKPLNSFGTLYHERHHSLDAIIKQELGVVVEPILGVPVGKYDAGITHGKCEPWKYIRVKENTDSLVKMKPLLQKAFAKRRQRLESEQNVVARVINYLAYVYRMKLNEKVGVKKV